MHYFRDLGEKTEQLQLWLDFAREHGADTSAIESEMRETIGRLIEKSRNLPPQPGYLYEEPDDLDVIKALRPNGPRRLELNLTDDELKDRLLGALLGRAAGCTLGVPVEGQNKAFIEAWAKKLDQPYPLAEYWNDHPGIQHPHYTELIRNYIKDNIDHVGPDDDIVYTVLGLLILEKYGPDFTTQDVGKAWVEYLPTACTAEMIALENLKKGITPPETALVNNPYAEWIGADIRSDPWAYAAPGMPELAAEFGWRDARVSHIRNGIYGEMFFAAAISAAFAVKSPREALLIGLTEIPAKCRMAQTVTETLDWVDKDHDWDRTWHRIEEKYRGMNWVHTLNNAAITISALLYSEGDFERAISFAVMGGMDTDCNGATAGSLMGAMLGAKSLPKKWTEPFGDRLTTYINGQPEFSISDLVNRAFNVAKRVIGR